MSHFFRRAGYDGWAILLDEAELIGRMGKKTRLKSCLRIGDFLKQGERGSLRRCGQETDDHQQKSQQRTEHALVAFHAVLLLINNVSF
jgi:hypothetical protein